MFVSQTVLVEQGTPVARFAGIVRTVPEAMSYVPPAQRPAEAEWGNYALEFDLRCSVVLNPIGVRNDGTNHLIVLYDLWPTAASRLAGDPPALRNSHQFGVPASYTQAEVRALVVAEVENYVLRAALNGWAGDQRDPLHTRLAVVGDAGNLYDKVKDMPDKTRDVDRTRGGVPLLTTVPK